MKTNPMQTVTMKTSPTKRAATGARRKIRRWPCLAVLGWIALGAAFAQAQPYAYVTNYASNTVSVIDTANGLVTATIHVGSFPSGVAITPSGAYAYVTNT
ncbi:MAG: YncE family protein, partial [Bryobacteraceae bacterium]